MAIHFEGPDTLLQEAYRVLYNELSRDGGTSIPVPFQVVCSPTGPQIIALFDGLLVRLLGIAFASFSSGWSPGQYTPLSLDSDIRRKALVNSRSCNCPPRTLRPQSGAMQLGTLLRGQALQGLLVLSYGGKSEDWAYDWEWGSHQCVICFAIHISWN